MAPAAYRPDRVDAFRPIWRSDAVRHTVKSKRVHTGETYSTPLPRKSHSGSVRWAAPAESRATRSAPG